MSRLDWGASRGAELTDLNDLVHVAIATLFCTFSLTSSEIRCKKHAHSRKSTGDRAG
jgi:hypothetical protein